MARSLFVVGNPLGKKIPTNKYRVVGVMKEFRKSGEFSQPVNYLISRIRVADTTDENVLYDFLIKATPTTTAAFQERLVKTMEAVEKDWTFDVVQLERERDANLKRHLTPLIAGGCIAAFLLVMVAFGLTGVLWQNVAQRTKEIGLRRAVGASSVAVSRQIHGEQFIITTLGVATGSILVLQVPLMNFADFIPAQTFITSYLISVILIYTITFMCSLVPGWIAMRIEPAAALHRD